MKIRSGLCLTIVSAVAISLPAFAIDSTSTELVVSGCDGLTRAMSDTKGGSAQTVRVSLSGTVKGIVKTVPLKNNSTGKVLSANVDDGVATFESVAPGTWSVCPLPESVVLDEVSIETPRASGSFTTVAAGVGAIGGAAALIGMGSSGSSSGDSTEVSSSNGQPTGLSNTTSNSKDSQPSGSVSGNGSASNANKPAHTSEAKNGKPKTFDESEECFADATPEPISLFK